MEFSFCGVVFSCRVWRRGRACWLRKWVGGLGAGPLGACRVVARGVLLGPGAATWSWSVPSVLCSPWWGARGGRGPVV